MDSIISEVKLAYQLFEGLDEQTATAEQLVMMSQKLGDIISALNKQIETFNTKEK